MRKILFPFKSGVMRRFLWVTVWCFISILWGGNEVIDPHIENVLQGNTEQASAALPELINTYPNHPGVMYLQSLLEMNGDTAVEMYKLIYKNHPNSEYADDAVMRIGEYYYVSGLYIQSADWFKKMPVYYPWSEHIERGVNLFLNCLIVAGSVDTAQFYSQVFQKRFPKMEVEERILTAFDERENSPVEPKKQDKQKTIPLPPSDNIQGKYSLQVGAFGSVMNANTAVKNLKAGGYSPRVEEINNNGKKLYAVRLGYFNSSASAKREGDKLRMQLGYDNIIITNY